MSGSDNIAAGLAGGLQGVNDLLGQYINYQYQRKGKQQDMVNEMNLYQQKLPLQEASTIRTKGAELAQEYGYKNPLEEKKLAAERLKEHEANYVSGADILAAFPDAKVDSTQQYHKSLIPALVANKKTEASDNQFQQKQAQSAQIAGMRNETAAGKTGILADVRNSLFGTPGLRSNQGFSLPVVNQPLSGTTPSGRKFTVIK